MGMMQEGWLFNKSMISRLNWMSWGLPTGLLQRWIHGSETLLKRVKHSYLTSNYNTLEEWYCKKLRHLSSNVKQNNILRLVHDPTGVRWWWFVVYPFDDFEPILSCDYCDTGNTGNEVLQGNTTLQCLIAKLQWPEFCSIAVGKTKGKGKYNSMWKKCLISAEKLSPDFRAYSHLSSGRVPSCECNRLWTSEAKVLRDITTNGIL